MAPDAIKQLDDSVASPKDETIAFNKVTKLVAVSDNKEIAHEDLKQPVSTETLDEELPDKKQEQPKATIFRYLLNVSYQKRVRQNLWQIRLNPN